MPRTPIPSDPPTPGLRVPLYGALRPLRALGCAGPLFRGDGAVGHTEDSPIALGSHSLSVGGVGGSDFPARCRCRPRGLKIKYPNNGVGVIRHCPGGEIGTWERGGTTQPCVGVPGTPYRGPGNPITSAWVSWVPQFAVGSQGPPIGAPKAVGLGVTEYGGPEHPITPRGGPECPLSPI